MDEGFDFTIIQEIVILKEPFDKLWEMVINLFNLHEKWMNGSIIQVNSEEVEKEVCLYFI